MREVTVGPSRTLPVLASVALLGALVLAMLPGHSAAAAVSVGAIGVTVAAVVTVPGAVRLLWRHRSLLALLLLVGLAVAWVVVGIVDATTSTHPWTGAAYDPGFAFNLSGVRDGSPIPAGGLYYLPAVRSWPWELDGMSLWPLLLALVSAAGGFVLIADAVRVQIGLARPPRSVWRSLTATPTRGGRTAIRAVPGVVLVGVAALLAVGLVNTVTAYHPIEESIGMVVIAAVAALLVASPVAVGLTMRLDFDKEQTARDRERQRFAAHLHDSVLQTLALIQRQSGDAEAVMKLARRQEHALRVWMAGEADLGSATVAVALRDVIAELEDETSVKVELTATGDAKLDTRSEELVAAAREALRNVVRHAPGVPVNVFLDVGATGTEVFIRDSGPGFRFEDVPAERRGLRDAVIGRMRFAGGNATVESTPGEGTEVALTLPHTSRRTR